KYRSTSTAGLSGAGQDDTEACGAQAASASSDSPNAGNSKNLMLRSRAQRGVSKHGHRTRCSCLPFETRPAGAPQGEVSLDRGQSIKIGNSHALGHGRPGIDGVVPALDVGKVGKIDGVPLVPRRPREDRNVGDRV